MKSMEAFIKLRTTSEKLIATKVVFTVTIVIIILTILSVWLFGLGQHRTIFANSLLSISILSIVFFLFLTIGLYRGIKLKDNIGNLTDRLKSIEINNFIDTTSSSDFLDISGGIGSLILSIVIWIIVAILFAFFLWLFSAVLWTGIVVFMAMLYWIFFRALRVVFKNAYKCKGNIRTSLAYGITYAALYSFWIYGIILLSHYLTK